MTILWNSFTPWSSLAGGMLIGLAAAGLRAASGSIVTRHSTPSPR